MTSSHPIYCGVNSSIVGREVCVENKLAAVLYITSVTNTSIKKKRRVCTTTTTTTVGNMPVNTCKVSSVCFGITDLNKEINAHHTVERN
jgi:hypothetical protein